uniref:Uncharacterized protein n=1 Tax=Hyaloperonospora arabidopsidis (strain Emoy2) TaxID=559515 RepID=M4C5A6_HYAAE
MVSHGLYMCRQRGTKECTSTFSSMKLAPFEGDCRHAHRSSEDEGWFTSEK